MKKSIILSLFIVISFFFCLNVKALSYQATLTGNSVFLREGPGTSYNKISSLSIDSTFYLADANKFNTESGCDDGWYKIYYSGTSTGYVCSTYISIKTIYDDDTKPTNSCETEMQNKGFPASYWSGLCSLKEKHSNWNFEAIETNLDWSASVTSESACGLSYISTSNQDYIDNTCTSVYSSTSSWHPASQLAVAYYMDPRNFLTEKHIFQFQYLRYASDLSNTYMEGINSILKTAAFYKYHVNNGINFADTLNQAGNNTNVNPIFLATRILQELGNSDKLYNLYSGIYTYQDQTGNIIEDLKGLYNFYNIGVSDSCATSYGTTYCGLNYAQKQGWNSIYNALAGGANTISSYYIAKGQYINYLQKFNVVPTDINKIYNHQYMTNISAPSSESVSSYNTYNKLNLLNSNFAFYIPVYKNMNQNITNNGSGASKDEEVKTPVSVSIDTLVTSAGYHYSNNYLTNIMPSTDASTIISNLEAVGALVSITNNNGDKIVSGVVGTGNKITINNSQNSEILTIIINGDTSGDGIINALDLLQVQKNILGTYNLSGPFALAGDTSDDGTINALDLLQIQKNILGTFNISQ